MVNYANSKIYRIVCNITGLTYYGSTTLPLSSRLRKHKHNLDCSSKIIIESGNYDIVLVETFACNTKEELHARERFYIESNKCINKVIPTRTDKEYREANKEHYSAKKKEYREANKEEISAKQKEYYEANKEHLLAQAKEFRDDNKEHYLAQAKKYREANKQHNKERLSVKYTCECGSNVCLGKKARHNKTQKHLIASGS